MKKILFLLLLVGSCTPEPQPDHVLGKGQFMDVYIALARTDLADSTRPRNEVADDTLRSHGATEAEFRATVEYYNSQPELWKEFLDEVIRRLEQPAVVRRDSVRQGP